MVRVLGWVAIVLGGLLVLAVLGLLIVGGETRAELSSTLRGAALDLSDGGGGYHDGVLLWSETDPYRITVEELPTLEGRRQGTSYSGGFLSDRMSWFGCSLRELIARCLELRTDQVRGDASLDQRWYDVDVARPWGSGASMMVDWEPVHERILDGMLASCELDLQRGSERRPVLVLRAGPGWDEHLLSGQGRSLASSSASAGTLILDSCPVRRLVMALELPLGPLQLDGLDKDAICRLELHWQAGDAESLKVALARQLDLHTLVEERTVEVARVSGVPRSVAAER